jgi:transcriptional regulator with XRE-family HTH domain
MKSARERFDAWTRRSGLSTRAIGALIGCHSSYVTHIRKGRRRPSLEIAAAIARETRNLRGGPIRPEHWLAQPRPAEAA